MKLMKRATPVRGGAVAAAPTADAQGRQPVAGLGDRLGRGVVAGIFAGVIFLFAQMGWAVENLDKPAVAPMLDISTVFNNVDVPAATSANVVIGLVTHLTLTMLFGIAFALIVPLLRTNLLVLLGGLAFGVLLYVLNIQILGRLIFEWFTNPAGPPQVFELFIHAVYGLLLAPFFIGVGLRYSRRSA